MMKAEIISIGTEILLGDITDTNTTFLAHQLASLGVDLYFASTVGDNQERLLDVLKRAWQRSELIITTGGLGPTQDDITRETIAQLMGEEPEIDKGLKKQLEDYYISRGRQMPLNNLKQATLVPSARSLRNPWGTAPGWWVEREEKVIIALPGPPREMQPVWEKEVLPRLQKRTRSQIVSRTLKLLGLGESNVDELVTPYLASVNPTLATYAKLDGVYLRITAKARTTAEARSMIRERENEIRKILGDYIWGVDEDKLEEVVGRLFIETGKTLAIVESGTRGFLTSILTGLPRSTIYFKGSMVNMSNATAITSGIKDILFSEKASKNTAGSLASWVREALKADTGIGMHTTSGLTDAATTGEVYIAIDTGDPEQNIVQRYSVRGTQMKERVAYYTLNNLRNLLQS